MFHTYRHLEELGLLSKARLFFIVEVVIFGAKGRDATRHWRGSNDKQQVALPTKLSSMVWSSEAGMFHAL